MKPVPTLKGDAIDRGVRPEFARKRGSSASLASRPSPTPGGWHHPGMTDIDYRAFDALTFDCYGTLIDWETGILAGLRTGLARHRIEVGDDELLERFAAAEAALEAGPYRRYREILGACLVEVGRALGVSPDAAEQAAFGGSVADWPAFPDSTAALAQLKRHFRLGVITNCDDDLFAASSRRLGVEFDWVVTAEQARGYKPRRANFELAFGRIGLPRERVLHVAQSLFHDHVPAKAFGLTTVWIDRRHGRPGAGATPAAAATPDAVFPDMASFAGAAAAVTGPATR
jgi:2-haloacid dehalogenase